ncbi:MAG: acetyl-CoA carboxylase biotin carboxyl carrier protein [Thermodesulfobacteriota bacterium]
MDMKDIKAIYRFLRGTDIAELEVEDSRGRVRIKRGGFEPPVELRASPPLPPQERETAGEAKEVNMENLKVVTSPMVGTFYRAPSPEAPPFAETGSPVKAGQVLCLIEAMKTLNEVESEYTGKVASILVENGQPVEYGEPIFYIEV